MALKDVHLAFTVFPSYRETAADVRAGNISSNADYD